jgi:hypothetical protein
MRLDRVEALERGKHANIEGLQYMRAMWRHDHKIYIMFHAVGNEISLYMASMPISNQ